MLCAKLETVNKDYSFRFDMIWDRTSACSMLTITHCERFKDKFKQAQKDDWVKLVYVILVFSSNLIKNGLLGDTLTSYDFRIGSR